MKSKYGFYKVATGNILTKVGDVTKNKDEIISLIEEAKKEEVNVLTFSELTLTGYTSSDLFYHQKLSNEIEKAIKEISQHVPSNMIVFVGGPFYYLDRCFDVAFVFSNQKLIGIVPKTYLPNYDEFYEKRWFNSSKDAFFDKVKFNNEEVPFGCDLIFDGGDIKIGCEICEDLWVINPPSNELSLNGCNVICNLSGSNEVIGKREYRKELVKNQSARLYSAYIYSSCGFGESTQDLVFSGHQLIYESGKLVNESYDEKGLLIGLIDVIKLSNDRTKHKTSFECESFRKYRYIDIFSSLSLNLLPEFYDKAPFLVKNKKERIERTKEIISLQAKGLATRLYNSNFKKVVIGVSGGLDSTLALIVIHEAYKYLNLDSKDIHCFTLPGLATSSLTFNNAKKLIEILGCSYHEISIKEDSINVLKNLNHPLDLYDVTYENVQARLRTMYLMNFANQEGGMVIGTGDLSELALGFMTYNGDHMSMYAVNCSIPKTLVKVLVQDYAILNIELKEVLESIVGTPISPELVPSNNDYQRTEDIIGKYDLHDFFLYNFIRNGFPKDKIFELAKIAFKNIDEEYIKNTLNTFYKRFFTQQFKRSCMPDGVKVGTVSLSPRGDFRLPSDIGDINSLNKFED